MMRLTLFATIMAMIVIYCSSFEFSMDNIPLFRFLNSADMKFKFIDKPFTIQRYNVISLDPLIVQAELHLQSTGADDSAVLLIEGYVCGHHFKNTDAETVCRSLGYTTTTATAVPVPPSPVKATCSLEHESWLTATMPCGDLAMITLCPMGSTNLVECVSSQLFNITCLYHVVVDCGTADRDIVYF